MKRTEGERIDERIRREHVSPSIPHLWSSRYRHDHYHLHQVISRQYDLQIGDISSYDIATPLDFADNAETMRRALEEMAQIPNVMIRSDALSNESSDAMRQLMLLSARDVMLFTRNRIFQSSPIRRYLTIRHKRLRRRIFGRVDLTIMRSKLPSHHSFRKSTRRSVSFCLPVNPTR